MLLSTQLTIAYKDKPPIMQGLRLDLDHGRHAFARGIAGIGNNGELHSITALVAKDAVIKMKSILLQSVQC